MKEDEDLIRQAYNKCTGANIHRINSLICAYKIYIKANNLKYLDMEKRIRIFIKTGNL